MRYRLRTLLLVVTGIAVVVALLAEANRFQYAMWVKRLEEDRIPAAP